MANRVQISLHFDDTELFNGLVAPWKANKELNPLIIRLLSTYFYSEDIRNMVDMFGEDAEYIEEVNSSAFEDAINNARDTLAFMNILTDSAQSILSDGIDDINRIAQDTGGSPTQESSFGKSVPSFGKVDPKRDDTTPTSVENFEKIQRLESQIANMSEDIVSLKNMLVKFMGNPTEIPVENTTDIENSLNNFADELSLEGTTETTEAEVNIPDVTPVESSTNGVASDINNTEGEVEVEDTPPTPPPTTTNTVEVTSTVVEEPTPVVSEPTPVVEEAPVTTNPEPVVTNPAPVVEETLVVDTVATAPVVTPVEEPVSEPVAEPVEETRQLDGSSSLSAFLDSGIAFIG